jgi:hypothetical protein
VTLLSKNKRPTRPGKNKKSKTNANKNSKEKKVKLPGLLQVNKRDPKDLLAEVENIFDDKITYIF